MPKPQSYMMPLGVSVRVDPAQRDAEHERLIREEEERLALVEEERAARAKGVPPRAVELARQIVRAAAKRRGEISDAPEFSDEDPAAKAVILTGQRRRGSISAEGAAELDDYLRKLDTHRTAEPLVAEVDNERAWQAYLSGRRKRGLPEPT
jgi:hypothetical protein